VPAAAERILADLAALWGGTPERLTYYGSVDATPLFVRLAGRYCAAYGPGLLDEEVVDKDGKGATVGEKVLAAVEWIERRLAASDLGFLEFRRRNPHGIPFQVWKDSGTSYAHRDREIADWDQPIAALEVQAYAYDALLAGAELFALTHAPGARRWRDRAEALREATVRAMWMPADGYFAMGVDRDPAGAPRWIDSIASNPGLLFDSRFFDRLRGADEYIEAVARRITGPEFLTEAGIRCRSAAEADLVDFQDYHGTWTVWMKETYDVVKGLHRQGLNGAARRLAARLLNAVNVAGAHVEFLYVSPAGEVQYDHRDADLRGGEIEILGTNRPELGLGWTVAAALAVKSWFGAGIDVYGAAGGADARVVRPQLDSALVAAMPPAAILASGAEIAARYARRGRLVLNAGRGHELDQAARARRRTRG
jgi:hypothetical protein